MSGESYRYVLIGGGLAAARAAEGIRELDKEGSVLMAAKESRLPYHRPPLTKGLLLGKKKKEDVYCKGEDFYRENRIDTWTGVSAVGLDPSSRSVDLSNGKTVMYEKLLLATGSRARRLDLPGVDLPGVYTIRTLSNALNLLSAMKEARRAVVIGGSYIGAETASALAQSGIETTMLFMEKRLLERLVDEELSRYLAALFQKHGVKIKAGKKPIQFKGKEKVTSVSVEDGQEIPADLVVLGVGAVLNSELAERAGLEAGAQGGVKVDETLQTGISGIFAAGDIADYPDPTYKKRFRVEHWDTAFRQGYAAGRNMAGANESYTSLPHYFTTLFDLGFSVWGDFSQWEGTLKKGDLGKTGSRIFYLEKGRLCGILGFDPVEKGEEAEIEELLHKGMSEAQVRDLATG